MSALKKINGAGRRVFGGLQPGFTAVELVVIIAVIAGGLLMLLPALTRAGENDDSAKCLSNLRKLGVMYGNYASDHGGIIPLSVYVGNTQRLGLNVLRNMDYSEGYTEMFLCPSWPPFVYEGSGHNDRYGMLRPAGWYNEATQGHFTEVSDAGRAFAFYNLNEVALPEQFNLLSDTVTRVGSQYTTWTAHTDGANPHFRHGGSCNVLFADGGVESADEERFVEAYRKGSVLSGSHTIFITRGMERGPEERESVRITGLTAP